MSNEEEPMLFNDWVVVLELSCMWQMITVREMAVKKILGYRVGADCQLDLLKLSSRLGITEIRDAAIRALSGTLRPIEMVELGADWQVDSWLLQGYKQLVEAPGGISEEDEHRLKWEKTSKLLRIRDEYLQTLHEYSYGHSASLQSSIANNIVLSQIKTMFGKELEDAVWEGRY
jgi:hypothetical protein